jgi:predicted nucleotidyltransferase
MIKTLKRLKSEKLIHPPEWLIGNTLYLCQMGSVAYGVSTDYSDVDVYGFCIPTRELVFPQQYGYIHGFDKPNDFEQWQQHHIIDKSNNNEYDFSVYNIMKYFRLVMECNPNMIDSLFVPRNCILHSTQISELVRENRHLFLHKGVFHKYKGYSFSQMHKMKIKTPEEGSVRYDDVKKHSYSTKFAYHIVRLLSQVEQILTEGTLVLNEKGRREQMKAIRNGEWSMDDVIKWFSSKELELEKIYNNCNILPYNYKENLPKIKELLITCLEMWYEDTRTKIIDKNINIAEKKLEEIKRIINS